ncbi:MAG: hypothetical protein ACR2P6_08780 [Gammaproteobacteria bacterium]
MFRQPSAVVLVAMNRLRLQEKIIRSLEDTFSWAEIDGYRQLPFWRRKRLDWLICIAATKTPTFWRWVLWSVVWLLLAETAAMRFELRGQLRFLPGLSLAFVLIPVVASVRRKYLEDRFGEEPRRDR